MVYVYMHNIWLCIYTYDVDVIQISYFDLKLDKTSIEIGILM